MGKSKIRKARFVKAKPTGTIISYDSVPYPSDMYSILRGGKYWSEPDPDWDEEFQDCYLDDVLDHDSSPEFYRLTTSDGVFYFVAQNMDGHGFLLCLKENDKFNAKA